MQKESEYQIALVEATSINRENKTVMSQLKDSLKIAKTTLSEMREATLGSSESPLDDLKKKLYDTRESISVLDSDRLRISQDIGRLKSDLKVMREEKRHIFP